MINGVHAIIYSKEAEQLRSFFKDVLELPSVGAGRGWLIFALPPAELAVHPGDGEDRQELYLMCNDVYATVEKLKSKGVEVLGANHRSTLGLGYQAQAAIRR